MSEDRAVKTDPSRSSFYIDDDYYAALAADFAGWQRDDAEDRVFRLASPWAWSQQPASRTSRIVANVAVFATGDDDIVMTRASFQISEFHAGDYRTWAGWYGHRLRRAGDGWEILVKQVNLIDCDRNLRNPSITL